MVKILFKSRSDVAAPLIQRYWDNHLDQGEHWTSAKYQDYEHTWTFPSGKSTVAILFAHNSQAGKIKKSGAIEWNPNKVDFEETPDLWNLIKDILRTSLTYELSKADVAYDLIGVSIHQCTMDRLQKLDCRFFMGSSGAMTIYSGAQGSNGSCKVYDKRKEVLDKGGPDLGVLTRYELTFKANLTWMRTPVGTEFVGGITPCTVPELVIMNQPDLDDKIEFEDHLIIAGLQQLPHLYCMMSKYKRKRIKELKCVSTFAPSISEADALLLAWFKQFHEKIIA